jgi:hypothetical protein
MTAPHSVDVQSPYLLTAVREYRRYALVVTSGLEAVPPARCGAVHRAAVAFALEHTVLYFGRAVQVGRSGGAPPGAPACSAGGCRRQAVARSCVLPPLSLAGPCRPSRALARSHRACDRSQPFRTDGYRPMALPLLGRAGHSVASLHGSGGCD